MTAALAGMGWGLHPEMLVAPLLEDGSLIELVAETALDVPLYWHYARSASSLLEELTRRIVSAASGVLLQQ